MEDAKKRLRVRKLMALAYVAGAAKSVSVYMGEKGVWLPPPTESIRYDDQHTSFEEWFYSDDDISELYSSFPEEQEEFEDD